MTPLHIEIAIHYHVNPVEDWPHLKSIGPAHRRYTEQLCEAGLLKRNDNPAGREFSPTEGLAVYIEALESVPLPKLQTITRWVMPTQFEI